MKSVLLALAAAVVGTAAGLSFSAWRFGLPGTGDPFDLDVLGNVAVEGMPMPSATGARPRLLAIPKDKRSTDLRDAVDPRTAELTFNFGSMPQHASSRAEFIFKNVGEAVLELRKGRSTCQCTVGELSGASPSEPDRTRVNPGEETMVSLAWKTEGAEGPFRHHADIETNDLSRPVIHLVVSGNLTRGLSVNPHGLTLGRIGHREGRQADFTLVAFQSEELKIQQCSLTNPGGADDASGDPLAKLVEFSQKKLGLEEVKSIDPGAQSGYRLTISLKPGLPLGPIDRKIRITTNLIEPVEMPLTGNVTGDVSVAEVGSWFPQYQFFQLGEIPSDKGISKPLWLIVGGKNPRNVQVKVKQTVPPELQAKVETPQPVGEGDTASMRWRILISIPPGTRPMSHADKGEYGQVILETTHPDHKEFVIDVSFLVNRARP